MVGIQTVGSLHCRSDLARADHLHLGKRPAAPTAAHVDGAILQDGRRQATLIPAAWNGIRSAEEFVKTLKMKAGLPQNYWSETIHFQRYLTETFS